MPVGLTSFEIVLLLQRVGAKDDGSWHTSHVGSIIDSAEEAASHGACFNEKKQTSRYLHNPSKPE
jgi:hypothetical protein